MNSADTVTAVMQEIHDLRENDRGMGRDSRWNGLDAIPKAVHQALKKHGGHITHEVLSLTNQQFPTEKVPHAIMSKGLSGSTSLAANQGSRSQVKCRPGLLTGETQCPK
jgi:hypothetical protein